MNKRKKISIVLIHNILILVLILNISTVSAKISYYEAFDEINDVYKVSDNSVLSSDHPFIDITHAKVLEKGDNFEFRIKTKKDISSSDSVSYGFIIKSSDNNEYYLTYSSNKALFNNYVNCINSSFDENIIILVPKESLSLISNPMSFKAYSKFFENYRDELNLEEVKIDIDEFFDSNNDAEQNNTDNNAENTPGFGLLVLFLSIIMIIVVYKKKSKSK